MGSSGVQGGFCLNQDGRNAEDKQDGEGFAPRKAGARGHVPFWNAGRMPAANPDSCSASVPPALNPDAPALNPAGIEGE